MNSDLPEKSVTKGNGSCLETHGDDFVRIVVYDDKMSVIVSARVSTERAQIVDRIAEQLGVTRTDAINRALELLEQNVDGSPEEAFGESHHRGNDPNGKPPQITA